MKGSLQIRPATRADVPQMLTFIRELAEYERLADRAVGTEELLEEALFGHEAVAEGVIAEISGRPVGHALYFRTFSTFLCRPGLWLEDLYVAPAHRRAGVGRRLLAHVAELAVHRGYGRVEWTVLDWNTPARGFYASIGAVTLDDWRTLRVDGGALEQLAQKLAVTQTVGVPLRTVALEWTRIGVTGFGGPPTHIALIRRLVVDRRGWMAPDELEDAIAACNLLPGPASTQLAIFCARRVAGPAGAVVGGLCFVVPAVAMVTALSLLFLSSSPPTWIRGAGAGAGAAVAAVAVRAGVELLRPSWRQRSGRARYRWLVYVLVGALAAWLLGPYVVLVLLACGSAELLWNVRGSARLVPSLPILPLAAATGGVGALVWVALKVGALSFGGGFVIVPLMRADAVHTYHWMTASQFLSAVALGQVTPGPVVATVAAVGYAARGVGGAILAATVAFLPSFLFVLVGGGYFQRLRGDRRAQSFLAGAGPAAIGAIFGAAIPLAAALHQTWQFLVLAAAAVALLLARRGIVETLVLAGLVGVVVALTGGPVS